jgi:DGQHR domain-containing protein
MSTSVLSAGQPTTAADPLTTFAVRFRQKRPDVSLYVSAVPLKALLPHTRADTYRTENKGGYQRPVMPSRLRQLSTYMRTEEGMLPTSILLCIRQPQRAQFQSAEIDGTEGELGMLTVDADVPLWVVDGQHRLFGLQRALIKDKVDWLADYLMPVTIVEGIDAYEEMRYFHVINTRQKGVPTDVVDRHLLTMRETEGPALLEREGERNYQRARATKLVDLLNSDAQSPWRGKIRMAGEALRPEHLARQHSIVMSLAPVVNDSLFRRLGDEDAGKLVLNYWRAAAQLWQSAFESPEEYVIQKPMGSGALHQIFSDVLELCRSADDFSTDKMRDILSDIGRSAGFWHSGRGHYMVRETGSRAVRTLAQYLRERLPRPVLRRL